MSNTQLAAVCPTPIVTLDDAEKFLAATTNYEQRLNWSYRKLGYQLDEYREFLAEIGNPQDRLPPTIHVTGSKGKGSTCMLSESLLRAAGARTGLFVSPHVESITERIQLDGRNIDDTVFIARLNKLRPHLDRWRIERGRGLTYFEVLTTLAFDIFTDPPPAAGETIARPLDACVFEVGLGGRLDTTNVIPAAVARVATITTISLEHTDKLGETLHEIALEKAGIVKPTQSLVLGVDRATEAGRAITAHATGVGVSPATHRLTPPPIDALALEDGGVGKVAGYPLALIRDHRSLLHNVALARASVAELAPHLPESIRAAVAERSTLARALDIVRLPARAEPFRFGINRLVILDAAHTDESLRAVARLAVRLSEHHQLELRVIVFGCNRDKAVDRTLDALASGLEGGTHPLLIATTVPGFRGVPATELAPMLAARPGATDWSGIDVIDAPEAALATALELIEDPAGGIVLITGSFYLAGALRPLLRQAAAGG